MPAERFLIFGRDRFVKKRFIRTLRDRLFPKGAGAELNAREWDAAREGWQEALDFLRTAGFLSDKRLAVLWNADAVHERESDRFLAGVRDLPSWAALVLESSETNVRKNAFLQSLSQAAKPVPCHAPFERELPGWAVARARETGVRLDAAGARLLAERVGRDLGALDGAVETLSLFVHPRREAGPDDVARLFGPRAEEDVFGILDRMIESDTAAALAAVERLLEQGGRAQEILAALAGQLEKLSRAQAAVRTGRSELDAAQAAGVHPYYREKFAAQVRAVRPERLSGWMRGLYEADEAVKSGALPDRVALERFLAFKP